ncbi:hypothetical protein NP493_8908g00004 [Ridgeia piscesae]|uniref:SAF domain-containing protein n=1 Tax=Ridgeia piscesae TaxID=27915 RepID=A0AAD9IPL2_RIDPI|nr:hypothetical protein NP493_8908g00004 [Ridgeia piscesae]
MNALKWTLALLLLCVALAPLIDASTEDEEAQILPDVPLIPDIPSDIVIIPDVRSADVLVPDDRLAPGTAVRVVHMPSDKGLVQQPSSALSRMLRVQV